MSGTAASACDTCESGKFNDLEGQSECTLCANVIENSETFLSEGVGAVSLSQCQCNVGQFLDTSAAGRESRCLEMMEGADKGYPQSTLKMLPLEHGFWRTNENSTDVRKCPTKDACLGGTDVATYCRQGHYGPYCKVCESGRTADIFGICKECEDVGSQYAVSGSIFAGLIFLIWILWKCWSKMMKKFEHQTRNAMQAAKISIVTFQILAFLPSVVPNMPLPESFSKFLGSISFFKLDFLGLLNLGCVYDEMNYYYILLFSTAVPVALVCVILLVGAVKKEARSSTRLMALAITYIVLPTVSIIIFGTFPCDEFDDGGSYLRADYSVNCLKLEHKVWVVYAFVMMGIFPIGVPLWYTWSLVTRRERIKMDVKVREEDEELMAFGFLFAAYRPKMWWFEIFDTARRLMLTGVLGTINPGTGSQLIAGMLISGISCGVYAWFKPYISKRDNIMGIMANVQIYLVMIVALALKQQQTLQEIESLTDGISGHGQLTPYDENLIGAVLIVANLFLVLVVSGSLMVEFNVCSRDEPEFDESDERRKHLFNAFSSKKLGDVMGGSSRKKLANVATAILKKNRAGGALGKEVSDKVDAPAWGVEMKNIDRHPSAISMGDAFSGGNDRRDSEIVMAPDNPLRAASGLAKAQMAKMNNLNRINRPSAISMGDAFSGGNDRRDSEIVKSPVNPLSARKDTATKKEADWGTDKAKEIWDQAPQDFEDEDRESWAPPPSTEPPPSMMMGKTPPPPPPKR